MSKEKKEEPNAVCLECTGIVFSDDNVNPFQCSRKGIVLERKIVEELVPIVCDKFDPAPRMVRVPMRKYLEVGITTVYGGGSVQLPKDIREELKIKDGDKILWIRKGRGDYAFRKVGYELKASIEPHFV